MPEFETLDFPCYQVPFYHVVLKNSPKKSRIFPLILITFVVCVFTAASLDYLNNDSIEMLCL